MILDTADLNIDSDDLDGSGKSKLAEELQSFSEQHLGLSVRATMDSLLNCLSDYNPLTYWTEMNRQRYETMFRTNCLILSMQSASILQERVFSSFDATLDKRRMQLLKSPHLFQSITVGRLILSEENAAKEKERKSKKRIVEEVKKEQVEVKRSKAVVLG